MKIGISRLHFPVTTLGPGQRVGIWFQGCSLHCEGCISADTWQFKTNSINIEEVKNLLKKWLPTCDGITISGGEPFDQEPALQNLLKFLKPYKLSLLVYSGYSFQELKYKKVVQEKLIDVLISEPYDYTKAQTRALLGSDNQQIHFLTNLGALSFAKYLNKKPESKLDIQFNNETLWMAGIPINGMNKITESFRQNNVEITNTQAVIKQHKK
ncbi:4Fe-4S single cluster domain-containing protein [Tenacibaculum sp. ZH5_bin.1]|uniref:4Fe-4S single cluster domain-containing protein n=1 Tax=unclassified Tenacibaculum TaxID=2635139 RepID=UPI0036E6D516